MSACLCACVPANKRAMMNQDEATYLSPAQASGKKNQKEAKASPLCLAHPLPTHAALVFL